MMLSFPKYSRRLYLYTKVHLTHDEQIELAQLHEDLKAFRRDNPDWTPDLQNAPLKVTLGDVVRRFKK
jgi:hypothetical protein